MTESLLAAIVFILILGLGKIYNRIDEVGKPLTSRRNNEINEILDSLNKIESLLEEISANILMR